MSTEHNLRNTIKAAEATTRNARRQLYLLQVANAPVIDKEALAKAARVEKYQTKNGLTIDKLKDAGNTVTVSHIRFIEVVGEKLVGYITVDGVKQPIYQPFTVRRPVPSYLRKDFEFTPNGGSTYINIRTPDGGDFTLSSHCHDLDPFDYKLGVKKALDTLSEDEAAELLVDVRADYQDFADIG